LLVHNDAELSQKYGIFKRKVVFLRMQIFVIDKIQASKLTTRKELNKFLKISTKLMI